jgi:hypothetical protein
LTTGKENVAEIKLENIATLNVQDGDLVVIRLSDDVTDEIMTEMQNFINQHFKTNSINASCIIIPNDTDISVLRPAPTVAGGDADEKA